MGRPKPMLNSAQLRRKSSYVVEILLDIVIKTGGLCPFSMEGPSSFRCLVGTIAMVEWTRLPGMRFPALNADGEYGILMQTQSWILREEYVVMRYWMVRLVSLLASSVGFHMYIWFFSVGYGLSIAAIGAVLAVGFHARMALPEWIGCLLLIVYGLRLGGYLLYREMKSAAYRKVLSPELERSRKMPIVAKLALWVTCALLYTLMTLPLYFRLANGAAPDAMLWIGLAVMACGMALECLADLQKSAAKKKNSRRFVDTGL